MSIVRVMLLNGRSFLATLCPEAIPYDEVQKGVSHKKYLEIDSAFAAELGISVKEQGVTVSVKLMCVTTPPTLQRVWPMNYGQSFKYSD